MKKAIVSLIAILSIFILTACNLEESTDKQQEEIQKQSYVIDINELGEFGEDIIINKNTDMPVTKRTYKLPSGNYIVTTDYEKLVSFFIVKDDVKIDNDNAPYIEYLENVGEGYNITAGENNYNGMAKKSVEITIKDDERINFPTSNLGNLIFTEK